MANVSRSSPPVESPRETYNKLKGNRSQEIFSFCLCVILAVGAIFLLLAAAKVLPRGINAVSQSFDDYNGIALGGGLTGIFIALAVSSYRAQKLQGQLIKAFSDELQKMRPFIKELILEYSKKSEPFIASKDRPAINKALEEVTINDDDIFEAADLIKGDESDSSPFFEFLLKKVKNRLSLQQLSSLRAALEEVRKEENAMRVGPSSSSSSSSGFRRVARSPAALVTSPTPLALMPPTS